MIWHFNHFYLIFDFHTLQSNTHKAVISNNLISLAIWFSLIAIVDPKQKSKWSDVTQTTNYDKSTEEHYSHYTNFILFDIFVYLVSCIKIINIYNQSYQYHVDCVTNCDRRCHSGVGTRYRGTGYDATRLQVCCSKVFDDWN